MSELGIDEVNYQLFSDNQSIVHLTKIFVYLLWAKQIHLKVLCSLLKDDLLKLEKIMSDKNLVDMLTKLVDG